MMMSPTSELTIAPKAAPMITPTARSTTLPRIANFLNSSSMESPIAPSPAPPRCAGEGKKSSVDQAGVDHGLSNRGLRLFRRRHHWQAQHIGAFADER